MKYIKNVNALNTTIFHSQSFRLLLSPEYKISENYNYNNVISNFVEMKARKKL